LRRSETEAAVPPPVHRAHLLPLAYEGHAHVVGFNLPFDLSRLAIGVSHGRGRNRGGFSFILSPGNASKGYTERRHRPRLTITHVNAFRSRIAFSVPLDAPATDWVGDFVDLRTLTYALSGIGYGLDAACRAWGIDGKDHVEEHGTITPAYIDYCRQDVRATAELYLAASRELADFGLPITPTSTFSSASLSKATLQALGVDPITTRLGLSPELLGIAMSAFYGGRAECHIRKTALPVRLVDFRSTYPTLFALLNLWPLYTAERWDIGDDTDAVNAIRELLTKVTVERCFDPAFWPHLVGYALIQPDGDVLPVRARYSPDKPSYNIGINPLTSRTPLWYALPDLAASVLATGRVPNILRVITLAPVGQIPTLRPLTLPGGRVVDPRTDNPFTVMTEERHRIKARTDLDPLVKEHYAQGLKIIGNAGCFGINAEYNPDPQPAGVTVAATIHGHNGSFEEKVHAHEDPGKYCCPPLAAVVTAAARLMLMLLERCVTDLGGIWVMADTDSMAICAATEGGTHPCNEGDHQDPTGKPVVLALTYQQVDQIIDRFAALNPYDQTAVRGSILEIQVESLCYAIAAKRYALFTYTDAGTSVLVAERHHRPSRSGLGHLQNPTDPKSEDQGWVRTFWEHLIPTAGDGPRNPVPVWFDRPALAKVAITSPTLLKAMHLHNHGKPYREQIKPFNFLLFAPGAEPPEGYSGPLRLLTSYSSTPNKWLTLPWRNQHAPADRLAVSIDPASPGTVVLPTYSTVAIRYQGHTEPKSLSGTHPCDRRSLGVLNRRAVTAGLINHIGKEANRLEDRESGMLDSSELEEAQLFFVGSNSETWQNVQAELAAIGAREIAAALGLSERRARDWISGHAKPRPRMRNAALDLIMQRSIGPYTDPRRMSLD